ncbi:hypothetical protein D3C72_1117570 [compost metagenome]
MAPSVSRLANCGRPVSTTVVQVPLTASQRCTTTSRVLSSDSTTPVASALIEISAFPPAPTVKPTCAVSLPSRVSTLPSAPTSRNP